MKRIISLLLAILTVMAIAVGAVSCGPGESETKKETAKETTKETT